MRFIIELLYLISKVWTIIAFSRFFLQKGGLHNSHPLARFCSNSTDFIVKKARKYIKPVDGWDTSIIVIVFGCYFIFHVIAFILAYFVHLYPLLKVNTIIYIIAATFIDTSYSFCYCLIIAIILYTILSLSEFITPLMQVLFNILNPLSNLLKNIKLGKFNISLLIILVFLCFWVSVVVEFLFSKLIYNPF